MLTKDDARKILILFSSYNFNKISDSDSKNIDSDINTNEDLVENESKESDDNTKPTQKEKMDIPSPNNTDISEKTSHMDDLNKIGSGIASKTHKKHNHVSYSLGESFGKNENNAETNVDVKRDDSELELPEEKSTKRSDYVGNSGEKIIEDYPPGFRIQFYERYESLIRTAKEKYGMVDSDFPKYVGPRYEPIVHSPTEGKTKVMVSTDIKHLEVLLKQLVDTYHSLEDHHADLVDMEKVKMRIHDCKRKLQILKTKQKEQEIKK